MKQITIKETIIGDDTVKICIPVSGNNIDEFTAELNYAKESPCDIVEVRYDYIQSKNADSDELERVLYNTERALNDSLAMHLFSPNNSDIKEKLILFTYRTTLEGGLGSDDDKVYEDINKSAIFSGCVDIVDIEFTRKHDLIRRIINIAHKNGVRIIVSKHFFDQSLSKDEIIELLNKIQETGADIAKVAVSVKDKKEAEEVISAAKEVHESSKIPFVTIGMGEAGKITRHIKPFYGSSITYAKGMKAAAPGQLDIEELLAHS